MLFDHGMDWNSRDNYHFNEVKYNFFNLTEYDIDSLKFRLTIEDKKTKRILFHQTVKSFEKIYKGDMKAVKVSELRNFNSKTVLSKADLSVKAEILEVYPKPKITPCTKIKKLENL
ncbi:hypothetical protein [Aquimarina sediminis]|uniref:hypothetical protein n=1 Tax=Aquimarina sediminis TaxID=2070536 RepID=UPI000CA0372D|nr:hypothetical protein [Aquimarina sediminis]